MRSSPGLGVEASAPPDDAAGVWTGGVDTFLADFLAVPDLPGTGVAGGGTVGRVMAATMSGVTVTSPLRGWSRLSAWASASAQL